MLLAWAGVLVWVASVQDLAACGRVISMRKGTAQHSSGAAVGRTSAADGYLLICSSLHNNPTVRYCVPGYRFVILHGYSRPCYTAHGAAFLRLFY